MELYRYKAMTEQGRTRHGKLDAANPADLEVRLNRLGLDLITYRQVRENRLSAASRSINRVDLISFCFHLEHLVRAGVPLLEGLADLRDTVDHKQLKEISGAMIELIEGGKNLSGAMEDFPRVFNPVFVHLIRAGEQTGRLPDVLQKIVENLKWQDEQAAYTKKLLTYPMIVAIVVITVVVFLMTYVVPQLVTFLQAMGQELPLQTRVLIATSIFFRSYWWLVLLTPFIIVIGVTIAVQINPRFAEKFDSFKMRLPLIGPILKKIVVTRVCNVFSIMYTSGITVLECVRTGGDVAGNRAVKTAMQDAGRAIADGAGISASFAATGLFPPLVIRMLRVGENSGALDEALDNVGYFYTRDVRDSVARLQALILPIVTLLLGAIVLWIMISILGPIYDLFTQIDI